MGAEAICTILRPGPQKPLTKLLMRISTVFLTHRGKDTGTTGEKSLRCLNYCLDHHFLPIRNTHLNFMRQIAKPLLSYAIETM